MRTRTATNTPVARSTTTCHQESSGIPAHQLWAVEKRTSDTSSPTAAGLKMGFLPRLIRCLDSRAIRVVSTTTYHGGRRLRTSATISPVVSRKLACATAGKKASFLDAPVTGSKHGAEKGELTVMIGGERETFDRAMPLLKVLGKKHVYCGSYGAGLSAKLAQNAIQSTMVEIFCEGFVLATKSGVRPEVMMEIVQNSMARATLTDFKAPFIFKGDFTPYFPLKWMHKDVTLAMEAAFAQDVPMPVAAAVKEVYASARAQGKGDLDYAAVITFLEELAGVKVRATEEKSL